MKFDKIVFESSQNFILSSSGFIFDQSDRSNLYTPVVQLCTTLEFIFQV